MCAFCKALQGGIMHGVLVWVFDTVCVRVYMYLLFGPRFVFIPLLTLREDQRADSFTTCMVLLFLSEVWDRVPKLLDRNCATAVVFVFYFYFLIRVL